LISDADSTLVVVARFLALLELYREGVLRFEQVMALGELQITWSGEAVGEVQVSDEFDTPPQTDTDGDPKDDSEINPETSEV
jgi:segregation and condensation protein A